MAQGSRHPEIPLWVDIDSECQVDLDQVDELPGLEGWDMSLFMNNDYTETSHKRDTIEIAGFLQRWLYFNVLSAGLGQAIKAKDFQREVEASSMRV